MNMLPEVSVVIPVYNAERSILKTLASVTEQTYPPKEIIVVNDGSTDASAFAVSDYIKTYEGGIHIKLLHQKNGGVSKARNVGMSHATGDYIALLDADDRWHSQKLERQMLIFEQHPHIDFLGCNRNGERWKNWLFKKFEYLTPISSRLLLYKTFFVTPTVIFKRSLLSTVGFFEETQRYAEEGNYWIRVCHQHHCVLLNESLVITGDGKPNFGFSGLSANLKEMEKGELKNMKLGYRMKIVGLFEYVFLVCYSLMKYIRRIIIVKLRRKNG